MEPLTETEIAVLRRVRDGSGRASTDGYVAERLYADGLIGSAGVTAAGRHVLALLDQVEELKRERDEARDRLNTIIDEEFGLQPPTPGESLDDCLTRLESLLFEARKHRQEANREEERRLCAAIRRLTVDMPDDQPNGPAEQALVDLQRWVPSTDTFVRDALARLCDALADDTRELRLAAESYFGSDFRAPQPSPTEEKAPEQSAGPDVIDPGGLGDAQRAERAGDAEPDGCSQPNLEATSGGAQTAATAGPPAPDQTGGALAGPQPVCCCCEKVRAIGICGGCRDDLRRAGVMFGNRGGADP